MTTDASSTSHTTPRQALRRLTSAAVVVALTLALGLGLTPGSTPVAQAHNCATAGQVLNNLSHCVAHAKDDASKPIQQNLVKPVGDCVATLEACANEVKSVLGTPMDAAMQETAKGITDAYGSSIEPMVKIWTGLARDKTVEFNAFKDAVVNKDLPKAQEKLLVLLRYVNQTSKQTFKDAVVIMQAIKPAVSGSLVVGFSAEIGEIAKIEGGAYMAIDLDYLYALSSSNSTEMTNFGTQQGATPIASLFYSVGGSFGATAGFGAAFSIGYDAAESKDSFGPSVSVTLAAVLYGGGGVEVVFNVDGLPLQPPSWTALSVIIEAGEKVEASLGQSYSDIVGVFCMDWSFMRDSLLPEQLLIDANLLPQPSVSCNALPKSVKLKSAYAQNLVARPDGSVFTYGPYSSWDTFTMVYLSNGTVSLRDVHGNYLGARSNGTVYSVNRNYAWERFTLSLNAGGTVSLRSFHNQFLGARSDGTVFTQTSNLSGQKFWLSTKALPPSPWIQIQAVQSTPKCITRSNMATTNNGVSIYQGACSLQDSWFYEPSTGYVRLAGKPSKCLHMKGFDNDWTNGKAIHLWDCSDPSQANGTWIFDPSTGYFRAANNVLKCLHLKDHNTATSALHLWDCTAGVAANKTWRLLPVT